MKDGVVGLCSYTKCVGQPLTELPGFLISENVQHFHVFVGSRFF